MSNAHSKLLSFLDYEKGYTLHFLNGKKLIDELLKIHTSLTGLGANYFSEAVLSFLPIISFLKQGEGFGFYVDSKKPDFKLKVEATQNGEMRTLLLPENFSQFPQSIKGQGRVVKMLPKQKEPYTSIVSVDDMPLSQMANQILHLSYQVHANLYSFPDSNQAILLMRLPGVGGNKIIPEFSEEIDKYWAMKKDMLGEILINDNDNEIIKSHLIKNGYEFLMWRDVVFKCKCSKEAVVRNVKILTDKDVASLFEEDQSISSTCEYCKKTYVINRSEIR